MFYLPILLILLLLIISMIISIDLNCYSNARLILLSSATLYKNLTLQSCQCLMIQEDISGVQYNSNEKSCYTFGNDSSRSNIRINTDSQVCFVNQISTVWDSFVCEKYLILQLFLFPILVNWIISPRAKKSLCLVLCPNF